MGVPSAVQTAASGGSELLIFVRPNASDSALQLSQKARADCQFNVGRSTFMQCRHSGSGRIAHTTQWCCD